LGAWGDIGLYQGEEQRAHYNFKQDGPTRSIRNNGNQVEKIFYQNQECNFFQHANNGLMCKNKWGSIFKEFEKIFDYSLRIG
jgi:hypothetical protein